MSLNLLPRSRTILLISFAFIFLILVSCSERTYTHGIDAVAQNGETMNVVEPFAGTPEAVLSAVSIADGKVLRSIKGSHLGGSRISPDGKFILYERDSSWLLVNIEVGQELEVGTWPEQIDFLPDGQMLITRWIAYGEFTDVRGSWFKIWTATTGHPESRKLITDRGQFLFQSRVLPIEIGFLSLFSADFKPLQSVCPEQRGSNRQVYIVVETDGFVTVVTGHPGGTQIDLLSQLSLQTMNLLRDRQRELNILTSHFFNAPTETVPATTPSSTPLSAEEINRRSTETASMLEVMARSGITGQVSPDGRRMALLSITSMQDMQHKRFSLDLIDLEQDTILPLSSDTEWIPRFLFAPDGSQILFESNRRGPKAWYLASPDGKDVFQLDLEDAEIVCWN